MKKRLLTRVRLAAIFTATLFGGLAFGQVIEEISFWPDEPDETFVHLGTALALDGEWAAVGDYAAAPTGHPHTGAVKMYRRTEQGWVAWQFLAPVTASFVPQFGYSVALHGDELVIGARRDGLDNSGRVYIYRLVANQWVEVQQLDAFDGGTLYTYGQSVAFDADTLVVGSHGYAAGGTCYVYERDASGWVFLQQLEYPDPTTTPYPNWGSLGFSCAVDGDLIVAGAPLASGIGMAFAYRRGAAGWHLEGHLGLPQFNPSTNMLLGYSVDVSEGTIAVGAPIKSVPFYAGLSSVWIFNYDPLFQLWTQTQMLRASDVNLAEGGRDWFGYSLALRGDRLVVGAERGGYNGLNSGTGYIFERFQGVWNEVERLVPSDPNPYPYPGGGGNSSSFGTAVALDGPGARILIGAQQAQIPDSVYFQGRAYFFDLNQGTVVCEGFPNANTTGTRLTVTGNREVSHANVSLSAYDGPPGKMGMFLMGPGGPPVPFMMGGSLCVGHPSTRLTEIISFGPRGSTMHQLDFTNPAVSNLVIPGAQVTFQFLHRDVSVLTGHPSINASDAVEVIFE